MPNVNIFPSTVFQASVTVEAILFGVFGFLYSVYAMYSSLATPEQPARAPICNTLKQLCRIMAALLSFNALLSLYSLYLMEPAGIPGMILTGGLAVSILAMVGISAWIALCTME